MRATNKTTGHIIARNLVIADTLWSRAVGLLGRKWLQDGEGLLIRPCCGVHTFFMKFPIDVIFLDGGNRVVAAVSDLKPHRITRIIRASAKVIEVAAGTVSATGTCSGNEVIIG